MRIVVPLFIAISFAISMANLVAAQDVDYLLPDRSVTDDVQRSDFGYFSPVAVGDQIVVEAINDAIRRPSRRIRVEADPSAWVTQSNETFPSLPELRESTGEIEAPPAKSILPDPADFSIHQSPRRFQHSGEQKYEADEAHSEVVQSDSDFVAPHIKLPPYNAVVFHPPTPAPMPKQRPVESAKQYIPAAHLTATPPTFSQSMVAPEPEGQIRLSQTNEVFGTPGCCDEWKDFYPCRKGRYDCPCRGLGLSQSGCGVSGCGSCKAKKHKQTRRCSKRAAAKCGKPGCKGKNAQGECGCKSKMFAADNATMDPSKKPARFSFFTINVNNYDR